MNDESILSADFNFALSLQKYFQQNGYIFRRKILKICYNMGRHLGIICIMLALPQLTSSHWNLFHLAEFLIDFFSLCSFRVCLLLLFSICFAAKLEKSVDHANNTSNRHIECEKWTKSFIFLLSTWSYFSASTEYRVCYKTVSWAPRIGDTNSFFFSSQVPAENPFSVYVIASKSSTSLTIFFMKFRAYFMSSCILFSLCLWDWDCETVGLFVVFFYLFYF